MYYEWIQNWSNINLPKMKIISKILTHFDTKEGFIFENLRFLNVKSVKFIAFYSPFNLQDSYHFGPYFSIFCCIQYWIESDFVMNSEIKKEESDLLNNNLLHRSSMWKLLHNSIMARAIMVLNNFYFNKMKS